MYRNGTNKKEPVYISANQLFWLLCYSSVSKMINITFESVILRLTEILDAHHCKIVELFCFADKTADIVVDSFQ